MVTRDSERPRRTGGAVSDDGIYGPMVTRAAFHADPDAAMALAAEYGCITIVDSRGKPDAVISIPDALECEEPECVTMRAELAALREVEAAARDDHGGGGGCSVCQALERLDAVRRGQP